MWWLRLKLKRGDRLKLEYYVFRTDINSKEIVKFNIFDHWRFNEEVKKDLKKCKTKEEFAKELKDDLRYYFWSKYEYEVVISSFPVRIKKEELDRLNTEREKTLKEYNREPHILYVDSEVGEKIDVYSQVLMNFSHVVDYLWSQKRSTSGRQLY